MQRSRRRPHSSGPERAAEAQSAPPAAESLAHRLADWLLTAWIVLIGIVYFGGYFAPAIGARTAAFEAAYGIMLIVTALALWNRWRRHAS